MITVVTIIVLAIVCVAMCVLCFRVCSRRMPVPQRCVSPLGQRLLLYRSGLHIFTHTESGCHGLALSNRAGHAALWFPALHVLIGCSVAERAAVIVSHSPGDMYTLMLRAVLFETLQCGWRRLFWKIRLKLLYWYICHVHVSDGYRQLHVACNSFKTVPFECPLVKHWNTEISMEIENADQSSSSKYCS